MCAYRCPGVHVYTQVSGDATGVYVCKVNSTYVRDYEATDEQQIPPL